MDATRGTHSGAVWAVVLWLYQCLFHSFYSQNNRTKALKAAREIHAVCREYMVLELELELKLEIELEYWKNYVPVNGMGKYAINVKIKSIKFKLKKLKIKYI